MKRRTAPQNTQAATYKLVKENNREIEIIRYKLLQMEEKINYIYGFIKDLDDERKRNQN